jgi:branched-subunit amino acid transport protein
MNIWLLILAAALVTFLLRFSMIWAHGKWEMPEALKNALEYIPSSAFAAILFPAIFAPEGVLQLDFQNEFIFAGLIAAAAAWKSKSIVITLIAGMIAVYGLQALGM